MGKAEKNPTLRVREITENDDPGWDELVRASPSGNRFLRADCLRMLEATDSVGIRFARLGAFDKEGCLRAGWALPFQRRAGIMASTYFEFFYAGPMLAPDLESGSVHVARERLEILHALGEAQTRRFHLIEAEAHPRFTDGRALAYAGFRLRCDYTHIWNFGDAEEVFGRMNRERRRLIRRAAESHRFGILPVEKAAEGFVPLYRNLMRKFDWLPGEQWGRDLQERMEWLAVNNAGAVYGAWDEQEELRGAVIVLLSEEDRTIYLWRCGYIPDRSGQTIVPALYWNASLHWLKEWGAPLAANLGGSPMMSLSQFKSYLGAEVVPHLKLQYRPAAGRGQLWRIARAMKERTRQRLTRSRVLGEE